MSILTDASLIITPNAYKAGSLLAVVPSNGNGDLTWTRNSGATRVNSAGLIENVLANVPRLDHSLGGCPTILLEPQRTNLLLNSVWAGGVIPTNWTQFTTGGTITPIVSSKNPNVTSLNFSGTATRNFISQAQTFTNGYVYAISFYVESVLTSATLEAILLITGATGTTTYLKNNTTVNGNTELIAAGNKYTLIFSTTATTTTSLVRIGLGASGNDTANFTISMPQMEIGASNIVNYSTSYIPTTSATVTRVADVATRNNIFTNGLISASGGTWFVEIENNLSLVRDVGAFSLFIGDFFPNPNSGLILRNAVSTLTRLSINKRIATTETGLFTTTTDKVKLAITWNGTTANVFVNGVKVVTNTAFAVTNMEFLHGNGSDIPKYIKSMWLENVPMSDVQLIAATTL